MSDFKLMKYTMPKLIVLNQSGPYMLALQIFLAMALFNKTMTVVSANDLTPEIPTGTDTDTENEINDILMPNEMKRNWQSLQGSWGKRGDWSALHGSWGKRVLNDNDFNVEEKRANNGGNKRPNWGALHGAWGKRQLNNNNNNMFNEQEKRDWQSFQGSWGKRSTNDDNSNEDIMENEQIFPVLITSKLAYLANPNALEQLSSVEYNDIDDENILNEKRNWNKMRGAWGKRNRAVTSLNRGAWGKREQEQNWNKFRGVWGKRTPKSVNGWLKFNNSWGKRSQKYADTN